MPTYEYVCPEGHTFDLFQRISDKAEAACPVCGKPATRKISGGAGLVFKGSGFYITDYGKDGKGPRKPSESGSATGSASGSAAGGESGSKPAESKSESPKKSETPAAPKSAPKTGTD